MLIKTRQQKIRLARFLRSRRNLVANVRKHP
jgi:hypothetical protein